MFQFVVDFFGKLLNPILPNEWRIQSKRRREEDDTVFETEDIDRPLKKFRMNSKDIEEGSAYFPSTFCRKTREICSQTVEVIDLDPNPIVETISLLDDGSSISDKENTLALKRSPYKGSPLKHRFRAPLHCRSPLKFRFKHTSLKKRDDDVMYVGTFTKDSSRTLDNRVIRKPLIKNSFSSRTENIMNLALKNRDSLNKSIIFDFQSRMKYSELLGKVLKSPELFSCSPSQRSITTHSKVIDLTDNEPSTSKTSSKSETQSTIKSPSTFIDLTAAHSSKSYPSSTNEVIDLDNDNLVSLANGITHHRIVSPVNTLKKRNKHILCTNSDYIQNQFAEIEKIKKEFEKNHEQLRKDLSLMSPLRKTFEKSLEERLKRHLKITTYDLEEEEEEEPAKPQLTDEMISVVMAAWDPKKPRGQVLVNNFNYQIKRTDLLTLSGLNWLNDEVINFYMELISVRGKQKDFPSVHTFSTFFYPKLVKDGYASLRRWTRKVDIFAHDLIVVPIHLRVHWCLAIIDFKKKTITYFDSMGQPNNACVNSLLRYLAEEHMDKKKEAFDTSTWMLTCTKESVPQQMNSCDCGVFACTFAEYATRESKYNFSQEDMPYFRRKMTYEILTSSLL